ncbi:alpha/beta-type small acid-soluble spore protein [Crassaminicella profunda]|uniref:alpha/beta-type small acid-soluble spore protein n=1 Tax=Crassaminicella profunda TaxID=1286698 RepID=UPI001CA77CEE|nr:alpha/beta-type small acid-soluble spore protein [Crassaminicella profunda]QZY56351.1 alpha/beta-type small acid-soluble spore protein [Crassaminicella profunda]
MTKNKLVVPTARKALDQFKIEMAKELGISNPNPMDSGYLASYHTGLITRKLVEIAEKQLLNKK